MPKITIAQNILAVQRYYCPESPATTRDTRHPYDQYDEFTGRW